MERDQVADNRLTDDEAADLFAALDDEYRAHAIYTQVLADFGGDVLPFANIVESEARHIDALLGLFRRYGLDVPANPWPGKVTRYGSVAEACRAGVDAEIDNAALYDRFLAGTTRPDVLAVYRNLQQASQQNHLPAFRRGAERQSQGRRDQARGARPPKSRRHRPRDSRVYRMTASISSVDRTDENLGIALRPSSITDR